MGKQTIQSVVTYTWATPCERRFAWGSQGGRHGDPREAGMEGRAAPHLDRGEGFLEEVIPKLKSRRGRKCEFFGNLRV